MLPGRCRAVSPDGIESSCCSGGSDVATSSGLAAVGMSTVAGTTCAGCHDCVVIVPGNTFHH